MEGGSLCLTWAVVEVDDLEAVQAEEGTEVDFVLDIEQA